MPVISTGISFENSLDGTPVNWALLNVDDDVTIIHDIKVKTFSIASVAAPWILNNDDGFIDSVPGTSVWISNGDFSMFKIGDILLYGNYVSNTFIDYVTVINKQGNTNIEIDHDPVGWTSGQGGTSDILSLAKPITALAYKWNFIKNSEATNYFSKIDGSMQIANITNLNPAGGGINKPMTMLGLKPYQLGEITVDEIGLDSDVNNSVIYASKFRIKHKTIVTPDFLDIQWDDLVAGISSDLFLNLECLKFICFFEARYFVNDPNGPQVLQLDSILGNTGWFNENWNGNPTNYYVENLQYVYTAPPVPPATIGVNVPIPGVELSTVRDTKFQFNIRNIIDSPFVAGSTRLNLKFKKAPNDEGEYTNNTRDYIHNFVRENAEIKVQTSPLPVDGVNALDPYIRSLTNLKAFYVSADNILVTGKFDFDQLGIDVFEESNEPRYIFSVAIQNHSKQGPISDRVNLLVDVGPAWYQTEFPDLIDMESKLIPHDCPNYTDAFIDREKFTEDELVAYTGISVGEDLAVTDIALLKYTVKILALNTVNGNEFILDSHSINLPQASLANPLVNNHQYFNISQNRPFHIPAVEIRKPIIARNIPLTLGASYEFAYPFLNRWEYWVQLLTANSYFFDPTEVNQGKNHDWRHYTDGNWLLQYRYELSTKINGVPALYSDTLDFPVYNRNLIGENTTCVIKTYDPDTLAELVDTGGTKYVLGYKNTLIEAEFTNLTDFFDLNDTTVVLGIEVFEAGGHFGKRRISTKYVPDADTWFIPLTSETKAKLAYINTATPPLTQFGKVKASALLDFNALTAIGLKYKLTARVYGNSLSAPGSQVITYGQNYLGDQYVGLIPNNPIDEQTQVLPPKQLDCCSDLVWRVLADVNTNDPLKNDVNSFIWWFDKDAVDTAEISLVTSDGTLYGLNGDTAYGTPYDYGFEIVPGKTVDSFNQKAVAYIVDWKKVLTLLGPDTYYLRCDMTTIFGGSSSVFSDTYCLKQYTLERANGTVRAEYWLNGVLGKNENDTKARDFITSNWYNQHRFEGVFHFIDGQYQEDEIQYQSGLIDNAESGQTPEYIMKLKPIPMFKHNVMRTDILMSDKLLITDYNTRNIENYYQKHVKKNGNYEPKFNVLLSKLASVDIKFKQAVNNLNKYIS